MKLCDIINDLAEPTDETANMYRSQIIFNNGQIMAQGFGSTKDQAERNVSIFGLTWLQEHKQREINEVVQIQQLSSHSLNTGIKFSNLNRN